MANSRYWADRVAQEIINSKKFRPFYVDDMKTTSGYPTVGSLRGPLIHDIVYKALEDAEGEVKFTYIFNDFDPIDGLSPDLEEKFTKYMGFPLKTAPSPVEGYGSFGDYFASDFKRVLEELGVEAEFLHSWDLYHQGKFDEVIKFALDNSEKIQDIYQKVSGSKKREIGWLPFQVICQNCGRLGTTKVFDWDGGTVGYKCEENLVKWAVGCGHEARVSPFGGTGKLPWKVDWPAHWKVLGITIEGAGKDHASAGGSRDIAVELCKEVFNYPEPFNLPYEFILIGGKKMSTSKGLGLKARELKDLMPLELGRFLFTRTDYKQQVNFDSNGTKAIPDLYDEYDRCFKAFTEGGDEALARAFELSQIKESPEKNPIFLPRFREVVNYLQLPGTNLEEKFSEIKGSGLTDQEKQILEERKKYSHIWLDRYAPADLRVEMLSVIPPAVENLTKAQKEYLGKVVDLIGNNLDDEKLQLELYELAKRMNLSGKEAFSAIYSALIGKEFGPKAGAFLNSLDKEKVIERFRQVQND